jgi:hypothetical protein
MSEVSTIASRRVSRTFTMREIAPAGARTSFFKDMATVILLFVALRGALFGFSYTMRFIKVDQPPYAKRTTNLNAYWEGWVRWDSDFFMDVAKGGYQTDLSRVGKEYTNHAFLPLYPYTIRAAVKLVGGRNCWAAGLIISNIALVFGLFFMLRIARDYLGEEGARRSLAYLLLYPSSFFFSSIYSESMFLLTTTASFYYFLGRRYFLCGVWGFLAALTRNPGLLLFPAFVLGHLWNGRGRISREDLPALWLLLIPCGLLAFMALLYHRVGDPLAFVHSHAAWGRRTGVWPLKPVWDGLRYADWSFPPKPASMVHILDTVSTALFLILPFFLLKGLDKSLAIYSLLVILWPLTSGTVLSMMRCELAAFPSFLVLGRLGENRNVDRIIVAVSAMFIGLLNLGFSNWYFVG